MLIAGPTPTFLAAGFLDALGAAFVATFFALGPVLAWATLLGFLPAAALGLPAAAAFPFGAAAAFLALPPFAFFDPSSASSTVSRMRSMTS